MGKIKDWYKRNEIWVWLGIDAALLIGVGVYSGYTIGHGTGYHKGLELGGAIGYKYGHQAGLFDQLRGMAEECGLKVPEKGNATFMWVPSDGLANVDGLMLENTFMETFKNAGFKDEDLGNVAQLYIMAVPTDQITH